MITEIECVFVAVPVPGARLAHAVGMEKTAQSAVFRILPVIGAMLRGKESVSAAGSDVNVPDTVNQRKGVTNVMQRDAEYVGLVGLDQSAKNIAPPGREEVLGTSHVTRMGTRCAARDGMGPSVSCTVCHKTITSMDIILVTPVGKKFAFLVGMGPSVSGTVCHKMMTSLDITYAMPVGTKSAWAGTSLHTVFHYPRITKHKIRQNRYC